jgi:ribonucleotide reductase alpha subunit
MQFQFNKIRPPFGPLGYFTFKRTYARDLGDRTEEFSEAVERVLKASNEQLDCGFTVEEQEEFGSLLMNLKGSVAGRFWWQLGTKTVDRLGLMSLQNCAFVVVDEPVRPFTWTFDALMLGAGVGFNIQKENVYQLPKVKKLEANAIKRKDTNDADFIVPDSREGWVHLLQKVLEGFFLTGKGFSYSTVCIRGKGAPIKSFGGVASGPEELCWGIAEICKILANRAGKKIRPIDALDIMNIIGFIVVSGNVRRSAQLAIGDADDALFLHAKDWSKGNIPNWRAMSNNSVVCNNFEHLPESFWNGYLGNGEPYGLINLKLARREGRLGEERFDPIEGFNPCVEQGLQNNESCCLAELFLPLIDSFEEAQKISTYLYKVCKHSLALNCHLEETKDIVHKNMRMGIGITGYLQATDEQRSWLPALYEYLRKLDQEYSAAKGWPESIKLTTVKPSGTLSLIPGVTPGIHPAYSRYHIRRIRVSSNSSLVEKCRQSGYPVEFQKNFDGSDDRNTVVVSFPCSYPENTVVAKNLTAIQQLEFVVRLQREWSDNGVSVTVYYKKEELPAIKSWLHENYNKSLKAVSFLLHSDHGFVQAPYEEIDLDTYLKMSAKTVAIEDLSISFGDIQDNLECSTGVCPVR